MHVTSDAVFNSAKHVLGLVLELDSGLIKIPDTDAFHQSSDMVLAVDLRAFNREPLDKADITALYVFF